MTAARVASVSGAMGDMTATPEPANAPKGSTGLRNFGVVPGLIWAIHIDGYGSAEFRGVDQPIELQRSRLC
jgi:hypothetical protein